MKPLSRVLPLTLLLAFIGMASSEFALAKSPKASDTQFTLPPTTKKDALWDIARAALPNGKITLSQAMFAILRKNPHAFVGGNINRLHAGVVLTIPSLQDMEAEPKDLADDWADRHKQAWRKNLAETPAIYPLIGLSTSRETEALVVPPPAPEPSEAAPEASPPSQPEAALQPAPKTEQPAEMAPMSPAPTVEPLRPAQGVIPTPQPEAAAPPAPEVKSAPEPETALPPSVEPPVEETPRHPFAPLAKPEEQGKETPWAWYGLIGIVLAPLVLGLSVVVLRRRHPQTHQETIASSGPVLRDPVEPVEISKIQPDISPLAEPIIKTEALPPAARQIVDPAEDEIKLKLGQAYVELEQYAQAREVLLEVQAEGKSALRREVEKILSELPA